MKFTEGDVDIKLSNDGSAYTHGIGGTWVSPTNWAPGDELTASLYIRNDGPDDARQLFFDWVDPVYGSPNLLDKVEVTSWRETFGGSSVDRLPAGTAQCDTDGDGRLSLMELINAGGFIAAASPPTSSKKTNGKVPAVMPANGQPYILEMTFYFREDAGNEYQGTSASFDLRVATMGTCTGSDSCSEDG